MPKRLLDRGQRDALLHEEEAERVLQAVRVLLRSWQPCALRERLEQAIERRAVEFAAFLGQEQEIGFVVIGRSLRKPRLYDALLAHQRLARNIQQVLRRLQRAFQPPNHDCAVRIRGS